MGHDHSSPGMELKVEVKMRPVQPLVRAVLVLVIRTLFSAPQKQTMQKVCMYHYGDAVLPAVSNTFGILKVQISHLRVTVNNNEILQLSTTSRCDIP